MKRYSKERRQAAVSQMMPPNNMSVPALSEQTNIPIATLYYWRKQAKSKGGAVPGDGKNPEKWSAQDKFAIVLETAPMNASELSGYCRRKGLFAEQIELWKRNCVQGNEGIAQKDEAIKAQSKEDKRTIQSLERELRHKEKALAETAALLVLRKKAQAIWGESGDV